MNNSHKALSLTEQMHLLCLQIMFIVGVWGTVGWSDE